MGIDPGTARMGWAIIDVRTQSPKATAYGCITTEKTDTLPHRLLILHQALTMLFKRFHPDCLSVEDLYFSNNAKTAIAVGEARGVVLLTASEHKTSVISYSPPTVKQTICGDGKADKTQVQRMVTHMLHLREIPKPDDTADALAIALTHAYSYRLKAKIV